MVAFSHADAERAIAAAVASGAHGADTHAGAGAGAGAGFGGFGLGTGEGATDATAMGGAPSMGGVEEVPAGSARVLSGEAFDLNETARAPLHLRELQ